jgi:hypothetical protein
LRELLVLGTLITAPLGLSLLMVMGWEEVPAGELPLTYTMIFGAVALAGVV